MTRLLLTAAAVLCFAACGAEDAPSPAPPSPPPPAEPAPAAPVIDREIGEFVFKPGSLVRDRGDHGPRYHGLLLHTSGEPLLSVGLWPSREAWEDRNLGPTYKLSSTGTVEVPGIGPVPYLCRMQVAWPHAQRVWPPRLAAVSLTLFYQGEHSLVTVSHSPPRLKASLEDEPDEEAWHARLLAEAMATAGESPAVDALRALAAEKKLLDARSLAEGLPKVRGAVDGGDLVELAPGPWRRGNVRTYLLPAGPGQAARIEVVAEFRRFAMTTQGLLEETDSSASPGALEVRGAGIPFDRTGRALADLGLLDTPGWIRFRTPDPDNHASRLQHAVLLRFGRPEEEWLGTCEWPLRPALETAELDRAAAILSADLEAGFDPDRGRYLFVRGSDQLADPVWAERIVLEREPEEKPVESWLRQVRRYGLTPESGANPDELDAETAAAVIAELGTNAGFTWRGSWGAPRPVFAIALVAREFPELESPLRGILARWLEAMKEQPEPREDQGKGEVVVRSPTERAFVVAALHLAAERFGDPALQLARDRHRANLAAMGRRAGLHGDGRLSPGNFRRPCPLQTVAAQGQLAAFTGDEDGLARARQFIVRMLMRRDDRARSAYELYENASLSVRAGLLAVIRGKAALFEPPPIRR